MKYPYRLPGTELFLHSRLYSILFYPAFGSFSTVLPAGAKSQVRVRVLSLKVPGYQVQQRVDNAAAIVLSDGWFEIIWYGTWYCTRSA